MVAGELVSNVHYTVIYRTIKCVDVTDHKREIRTDLKSGGIGMEFSEALEPLDGVSVGQGPRGVDTGDGDVGS